MTKLLPFWRHRFRPTASVTSFTATSSSAVQADAVLKDDSATTRWVLQVCPEKPTYTNSPICMAKPSGARTPGWQPQSEHHSGGCRKQLGKAENLLKCSQLHSSATSQARQMVGLKNCWSPQNSSTELWLQHWAAGNVSPYDMKKKDHSSGFPPLFRALPMAVGYCGSPAIHLSFPSATR